MAMLYKIQHRFLKHKQRIVVPCSPAQNPFALE
jgi:hypothetical protein